MKAYVLSDRSGYIERNEVVFADTAREARRHGHLDEVAYIDIAAKRAPEFDDYATSGVPLSAKLANGWWQECGGCYGYCNQHTDGLIVDDSIEEAYCSAECQSRAVGRDAGREFARREVTAFEREAEKRWHATHRSHAYWNRPAYGEPLPAEGFRLHVRINIDGRWGSWLDGDADVTWDEAV